MSSISKMDEYRRLAAASLDSANAARDQADRTRRLVMAEAWHELAERTAHTTKRNARKVGDHPLVRQMLAQYFAEGD
jgi:hypothetical protein